MKTIEQAKAEGYTIDNSAAGRPWAYKGPRFNTTQAFPVLTELEADLVRVLKRVVAVYDTGATGSIVSDSFTQARAAIESAEGTKR